MRIRPLLPLHHTRAVTFTESYILYPVPVEKIKQVLAHVDKAFPRTDATRHLKRVKRSTDQGSITLMVYLASVKETKLECLTAFLDKVQLDATALTTKLIPDGYLFTKAQFDESNEVWPVLFHPVQPKVSYCCSDADKSVLQSMAADMARDTKVATYFGTKSNAITIYSTQSVLHPLQHPVMQMIQSKCDHVVGDDYLLTSYSVCVNFEPCIMCMMALLHSRIARLFIFAQEKENAYRLHDHAQLNHHFVVFYIDLVNE